MPDIHHIFPVKASPEKIFDAFCSPSGLDNWWTLKSIGEPKLNNIYTLYFGEAYDWRAEVIQVNKNLSLTWKMTQTMDDWKRTEVGFSLQAKEGQTQVSFFHKGWREASEHFGITNFCWGQLLKGLKDYVEKEIVVPYEWRN